MYSSHTSWEDTTHPLVSRTAGIASSFGKQGINAAAKLEKNELDSNFTLNAKEKKTRKDFCDT